MINKYTDTNFLSTIDGFDKLWEGDLDRFVSSPISDLFPMLFEDGLYHARSIYSYPNIRDSGYIVANSGEYKSTFPQSDISHGRANNLVCLFDFKAVPLWQSIFKYDDWGTFFYCRERITVVYKLNRNQLSDKLIPNNFLETRGNRDNAGIFCIPYVEAWYPERVSVSTIDHYIIVFPVDEKAGEVDIQIFSPNELSQFEAIIFDLISEFPQTG